MHSTPTLTRVSDYGQLLEDLVAQIYVCPIGTDKSRLAISYASELDWRLLSLVRVSASFFLSIYMVEHQKDLSSRS